MRAWLTHDFHDMRLEDCAVPDVPTGWALVRVLVVQPSITEVQLFRGVRSNGYDIVEARLSAGPQQLFGHEFSAEIVQIHSENAAGLRVGDRVSATHSRFGTIGRSFPGCFSELAVVPIDALAVLPEEVSDWVGAALQPVSSCVMNIRELGVTLGDSVVVFGQGVMGMAMAQAAKAAGADLVIGIDRRQDVLDVAMDVGVDATILADAESATDQVLDLTSGGADFVIEAAGGSPQVGLAGSTSVMDAIKSARIGGTVLSVAHYHEDVSLNFNFMRKRRLTYKFPPKLAGRSEMELAGRLAAEGKLKIDRMITHKLEGIEKLLEAFEITADKQKHGALNPAQVRFS